MFVNAKADGRHAQDYYSWCKFKPAISWSSVTSSQPTFRYKVNDLVDHAGMAFFPFQTGKIEYYLAFVNSVVAAHILSILSPTLNINAGEIDKLPIMVYENNNVDTITKQCKSLSKADWDLFETSYDYKKNPLI